MVTYLRLSRDCRPILPCHHRIRVAGRDIQCPGPRWCCERSISGFVPCTRPVAARHILGMALYGFGLQLPPVVGMTSDEVVESLGPTIQRYLGLPEA
ncbi:hypothetical protein [Mycobacterium rhizamassiliense]|uniref:TetR/AcrR family transcriptional regulator n=1 Tax=Mycobacterium rhizamassiliense TaxID=1841860 RepID=UPI002481C97E|nr:hypothetical protein [Mycobacterium rhizamassiliense]